MIGTLLLAATSIAAAEPDLRRLVQINPARGSAIVELDIAVDPKGKMRRCIVLSSFGTERTIEEMCALLMAARWKPARDADGKAVHSHGRYPFRMLVEGDRNAKAVSNWEFQPDAELEVSRLPDGKDRVAVTVSILVGADGAFKGCAPQMWKPEAEAYRDLACKVAPDIRYKQLVEKDGTPVPFVATAIVWFTRALSPP